MFAPEIFKPAVNQLLALVVKFTLALYLLKPDPKAIPLSFRYPPEMKYWLFSLPPLKLRSACVRTADCSIASPQLSSHNGVAPATNFPSDPTGNGYFDPYGLMPRSVMICSLAA
ncbi:hypothetical protein D3C72_1839560 [compost metagenome]